jgi:hypothetical protein
MVAIFAALQPTQVVRYTNVFQAVSPFVLFSFRDASCLPGAGRKRLVWGSRAWANPSKDGLRLKNGSHQQKSNWQTLHPPCPSSPSRYRAFGQLPFEPTRFIAQSHDASNCALTTPVADLYSLYQPPTWSQQSLQNYIKLIAMNWGDVWVGTLCDIGI